MYAIPATVEFGEYMLIIVSVAEQFLQLNQWTDVGNVVRRLADMEIVTANNPNNTSHITSDIIS